MNKYIKNLIAIISFLAFIIIGVNMYFDHINTNKKVDNEMEEITDKYLSVISFISLSTFLLVFM